MLLLRRRRLFVAVVSFFFLTLVDFGVQLKRYASPDDW